MRKMIYIILSLVLPITVLSGCSVNNNYSIKICRYSDSISESSNQSEFQDWNKGPFDDPTAKKAVELDFGNVAVVGSYVETEKRFSEFYNTHTYKDENNHLFTLTEDGKLSSYFFGNNPNKVDNGKIYTKSECIEIARSFISEIVDPSQYTVTAEYNALLGMYRVSFDKYVDGFKCSDQAEIMIEQTGYIYSFSSTMLGKIPANAKTNFNRKAVEKKIIEKLDKEYSESKDSYDEVSYENFNYNLTMDENGKYALICYLDVDCIDIQGENKIVRGERMRLLIQHA